MIMTPALILLQVPSINWGPVHRHLKKLRKAWSSLLDDVVNSKFRADEVASLSGSDRMKADVEREMNNYLVIEIDPSTVVTL